MSNPNLRAAEREWEANDPVVGANAPDLDEPIADPDEYLQSEKSSTIPSERRDIPLDTPHVGLSTRLNPLKRNPPPIPDTRAPSREPTAGWFSRLTFHWVTPIMMVSYCCHGITPYRLCVYEMEWLTRL
jgi:hypothetical protein